MNISFKGASSASITVNSEPNSATGAITKTRRFGVIVTNKGRPDLAKLNAAGVFEEFPSRLKSGFLQLDLKETVATKLDTPSYKLFVNGKHFVKNEKNLNILEEIVQFIERRIIHNQKELQISSDYLKSNCCMRNLFGGLTQTLDNTKRNPDVLHQYFESDMVKTISKSMCGKIREIVRACIVLK